MTKYLFKISELVTEHPFAAPEDAIIGARGRLGTEDGASVRVGEVTGQGVRWLGQWTYRQNAVWRPE